jgi:hypothetical protein
MADPAVRHLGAASRKRILARSKSRTSTFAVVLADTAFAVMSMASRRTCGSAHSLCRSRQSRRIRLCGAQHGFGKVARTSSRRCCYFVAAVLGLWRRCSSLFALLVPIVTRRSVPVAGRPGRDAGTDRLLASHKTHDAVSALPISYGYVAMHLVYMRMRFILKNIKNFL